MHITIHTADGISSLPTWQITESNTLHKLYCQQQSITKSAPICLSLPTICCQEIELFSNALHQKPEEFNTYFKETLSSDQQHMLISAAGKYSTCGKKNEKLNAKGLTAQLICAYFDLDIIKNNVHIHMPMDHLVADLKHDIVVDNVMNNTITHATVQFDKYAITGLCNGLYSQVPPLLITQNIQKDKETYYHGVISSRCSIQLQDGTVLPCNYIKQNNDTNITYFLTHNFFEKDLRKKCLFMRTAATSANNNPTLCKTIEHPCEITNCSFSNDGHYLATLSNCSQPCLILTSLGAKTNGSDFSDIFLTGHTDTFKSLIEFNPQSTLLALATDNTTYLWNTKDGSLAHTLTGHTLPFIKKTLFNHEGSTFFTLALNENGSANEIILWDMQERCSPIKTLLLDGCVASMRLNPYSNTITIATTVPQPNAQPILKGTIYLLNSTTGDIMHCLTYSAPNNNDYSHASTLSPDGMLLAVASTSSENKLCAAQVYNLCTNSLLTTLIQYKRNIWGVGFTPNGQSIVTNFNNKTCIQSFLYDDNVADSLAWLADKTDLLQRYVLYRVHRAMKNHQKITAPKESLTYKILELLPITPSNVQKIIKNYIES